jgi:hypothetical protein
MKDSRPGFPPRASTTVHLEEDRFPLKIIKRVRQSARWCIPLCLVFVAVINICIHWVHTPDGRTSQIRWGERLQDHTDATRFVVQAQLFQEGRGFCGIDGEKCVSLPPGYPYYLSWLTQVDDHLFVIQMCQVSTIVVGQLILFFALRRLAFWIAVSGAILIAMSSVIAAQTSLLMSEGFSLFLICVLIAFLVDDQLRTASWSRNAGIGFLSVFISLTSPFLVIIMVPMWLVQLVRSSGHWRSAVSLCAGACLPYIVWQVHCINSVGRAIPLMFETQDEGDKTWLRSWARSPEEFVNGLGVFVWRGPEPDLSLIPEHAFNNGREKMLIMTALQKCSDEAAPLTHTDCFELESLLVRLGNEAHERSAFSLHLKMPLLRGIHTWIDARPAWYNLAADVEYVERLRYSSFVADIKELGVAPAIKRSGRGVLSLLVYLSKSIHLPELVHVAILAYFLYCSMAAISRLDMMSTAIIVGILAFTFLHAYASPEYRRITPVFPLFAFLGCSAFHRKFLLADRSSSPPQ